MSSSIKALPPRIAWNTAWRLGVLGVLAVAGGCGSPPQMGTDNYRLVAGLRTAISSRRVDWLDAASKQADKRHAEGTLNDEQFAEFEAIVAQARDGQWSEAETAVIRLEKAQKRSPAEIERAKSKKQAKSG